MRRSSLWISLIYAGAVCAHGQWLNQPDPRTPRTGAGKPDLSAPAPRLKDGKPDVSGIWEPDPATREELLKFFFDGINNAGEDSPSRYFMNILYDFKPEDSPLRESAAPLFQKNRAGLAKGISATRCLPFGVPLMDTAASPYKMLQMPGEILMLYEQGTTYRQIYLDGRKLPDDPQPSWLGYSVGRWDSDALIVDTIGVNERTWLDAFGHPHSESMHVTERFRRLDFGHMELQITVDDPKMYTRPFTIKVGLHLFPDTDLIESFCSENEKDLKHLSK